MKLNQYERNVLQSGSNTTQFTATLNGAAFSILSDAIYQHKIAAIVREISCNAYDSHVEAGKQDVPFEVQLPNIFDPNLIITDYGVGLDDDGVRKVFASYFASTKNHTDDVTGGMGIGAKSIFSYSDTFIIRARKDGVERTYTAYIGEDGIPEVSLLTEKNTDEINGVRVSMPVRKEDNSRFINEAKVILSCFPTKPEVTGVSDFEFEYPDLYQQIEENGFAMVETDNNSQLYTEDAYALMGNVLYPIPNTVIHNDVDEFFSTMTGRKSIVLPFKIGELAPAASRETVSLDASTRENLATQINEVVGTAKVSYQEKVDEFFSPVDAIRYLESDLSISVANTFKYRGKPLSEWRNRRFYFGPDVSIVQTAVKYNSGRVEMAPMSKNVNVLAESNRSSKKGIVCYYILDDGKKKRKTVFKRALKNHIRTHYDRTQVMIFNEPITALRKDRISKLIGQDPTWIEYVDIEEYDTRTASARTARNTAERKDTTIYAKSYVDGDLQSADNIDVSEHKSLIVIESDETMDDTDYTNIGITISSMYRDCIENNIVIDPQPLIIVLTPAKVKKFDRIYDGDRIDFSDYMDDLRSLLWPFYMQHLRRSDIANQLSEFNVSRRLRTVIENGTSNIADEMRVIFEQLQTELENHEVKLRHRTENHIRFNMSEEQQKLFTDYRRDKEMEEVKKLSTWYDELFDKTDNYHVNSYVLGMYEFCKTNGHTI